MTETTLLLPPGATPTGHPSGPDRDAVSARLSRGGYELAARLGAALGPDHEAAGFLASLHTPPDPSTQDSSGDPIARLAAALSLTAAEIDVLLLAGLAEEHEGLAAVLRDLHPARLPAATTGLVGLLAEAGLLPDAPHEAPRRFVRRLLTDSPLVATGAVRLDPGPAWERTLRLADGLWSALHGDPGWPEGADEVDPGFVRTVPCGLRAEHPAVAAALRAVSLGVSATILVSGADPAGDAVRFAGLVQGAGVPVAVLVVAALDPATAVELGLVALARGVLPVVVPDQLEPLVWADLPAPVVIACRDQTRAAAPVRPRQLLPSMRPVLEVPVPPLGPAARRALWQRFVPDCPEAATTVPSGLSMMTAAALARDATAAALLRDAPTRAVDLRAAARTMDGDPTPAGVLRIRPTAGWSDLVLPEPRLAQLREAVAQVRGQDVVLDRWGFLAGRPGRRGVRLLFRGPPGTGKTLAAEVLAGAVGRDLLVVDLSRIVSKWIGETEKNLAAAFDAAERGDAVLLFDEADALFGKRTEVGDARDRYANLETAYLLSRLSWFDGVAVLATNLKQNIDAAFARRLEFVVPFDLPDLAERRTLWRRQIPPGAPLGAEVDLDAVAAYYPVTGALIRNAAVAAAYLAADSGGPIGADHVGWAIQREYAKAGLAYPGPPPEPLRASRTHEEESP